MCCGWWVEGSFDVEYSTAAPAQLIQHFSGLLAGCPMIAQQWPAPHPKKNHINFYSLCLHSTHIILYVIDVVVLVLVDDGDGENEERGSIVRNYCILRLPELSTIPT